jgi:hypothetical protein
MKAAKIYAVFIYSPEVQWELHKERTLHAETIRREFSFYAVVTWGINSRLTEVAQQ